MTTRGFVGFVVDGVEKIFVSHSDSYPRGAGVWVLDWLTRNQEALVRPVPDGIPYRVRQLRLIGNVSEPTLADVERVRNALRDRAEDDGDRAHIEEDSLEEMLEELELFADLDILLQAGVVIDGSDFPVDSMFCEWGYLIDLDTATFEVYRGFQRAPHAAGRFADRAPAGEEWYPVALVASWPLADVPDRDGFLAVLAAH